MLCYNRLATDWAARLGAEGLGATKHCRRPPAAAVAVTDAVPAVHPRTLQLHAVAADTEIASK